MERTIVALDPGFGNTKTVANGRVSIIQSVVARPVEIGYAATGLKSAKQCTEVGFGNHLFVVGRGSWRRGEPLSSMDYTALGSPARKALFYANLAELYSPGTYTIDYLIIGLPVPLLQDELQAEMIFRSLRAYRGMHSIVVNGEPYQFNIRLGKRLAQPVGTWADWLLNDDLHIRKGMGQAEVAVLDIGMNTLDLYVVQGGRVVDRFVGGDKVGVRRLLEVMNGSGRDMEELDNNLRTGQIKPSEEELDLWMGKILGELDNKWPRMKRFTAVIPTGGGAALLGETLRQALVSKGAAVHWPENPIAANAIGLYKWGCRELR